MNHPVLEDLRWRRTVKKYDPTRKVAQEDMAVFFEALRLSASSINSQPWKFIVLESDEAKLRMHGTFVHNHQYNQQHVFDSSHLLLLAYNPRYTREDYAKVVDCYVQDGRIKDQDREKAFGAFRFAELNTDETGDTGCWTKAQLYLALGNALHVLARLKIGATPLEGIDIELVNREFATELNGYQCDVALAIGYSHPTEDFNASLPKSRLAMEEILLRI